MTTPEVVEVSGEWLKSWWLWPRSWVDEAVRDAAAAWFLGSMVCACSSEAFRVSPVEQRRALVAVFAGMMREGVERSFLQADGRRAFVGLQWCNREGPCAERRLVRVVLKWP